MKAALPILAAALVGCASANLEPLATRPLQHDMKDERVAVVLLRYKTEGLPPAGTQMHDLLTKGSALLGPLLHWQFAVANESTGWGFRVLEDDGQVFRTRNDSIDPDAKNVQTGWVSFLAPAGTSYVALSAIRWPWLPTPYPDRISVDEPAPAKQRRAGRRVDLIDEPRIAVDVRAAREIVYVGTVVATLHCSAERPYKCRYDLTRADETEIARLLVSRYLSPLAVASPVRTRLFTIPQSRTITVTGPGAQRLLK